ncbi:transcriptional regulator [Halomarina oriensis]|uniref:Transcriptional regulator n=2 Tax=Halomarina oriensis TaxID=671145 RepID=A0A6B0GS12_9EURY|nr:transcriptional regulator [Halomarina oriensis]MWG36941.1 transcriptional regulator [Halomarina oriensis]
MQLPIDERILEVLNTSELILTPSVIAINIHKSREEVSRRLSELLKRGFVVKVQRGKYRVSEDGAAYLDGELDASELE